MAGDREGDELVTALLRLEISGRSDPGMVRRDNEDGLLVVDLGNGSAGFRGDFGGLVIDSDSALLVVADGMGGAAAGEVASGMALDHLRDWFRERQPSNGLSAKEAETLLHQAIKNSNSVVYEHAAANPGLRGMGTTLTCSWIQGDRGSFAQIGDSRAYLVRDGEMRLLTQDQSLRQHLLSVGRITPAEAERMADGNVILQALGVSAGVFPVITRLGLRPGDLLLLCSDGLNAGADDDAVARVLAGAGDLDAAAAELVCLANAGGGPDNITVVLARVHAAAAVSPSPGRVVVGVRAPAADQTRELVSISGEHAAAIYVSGRAANAAGGEVDAGDGDAAGDKDVGGEQGASGEQDAAAPEQAPGDGQERGAGTSLPTPAELLQRANASGLKRVFWGVAAVAALGALLMVIRLLMR